MPWHPLFFACHSAALRHTARHDQSRRTRTMKKGCRRHPFFILQPHPQ
ncbi:hypothetical protein HMPREF3150_06081 [Pseudomonas aeruginosa]|nr:hypothetical protein HMPREF3150_06081 [Pseudomonas aeruginosa]